MSNSVETKLTGCALNLSARPACNTSDVLLCVSLRSRPSPSVPPVWRPVSASAPPVKGVLVLLRRTRKRFFQVFILFLKKSVFPFKNSQLIRHIFWREMLFGSLTKWNPRRQATRNHHILGYPQAYPQESGKSGRVTRVNRRRFTSNPRLALPCPAESEPGRDMNRRPGSDVQRISPGTDGTQTVHPLSDIRHTYQAKSNQPPRRSDRVSPSISSAFCPSSPMS